ncbi:hypothetical protein Plhal304r1_c007g0026991 [Plasmopara halstedii]
MVGALRDSVESAVPLHHGKNKSSLGIACLVLLIINYRYQLFLKRQRYVD